MRDTAIGRMQYWPAALTKFVSHKAQQSLRCPFESLISQADRGQTAREHERGNSVASYPHLHQKRQQSALQKNQVGHQNPKRATFLPAGDDSQQELYSSH